MPVMTSGSAPGSAIVRNICQRLAPKFRADVEIDAVDLEHAGQRR